MFKTSIKKKVNWLINILITLFMFGNFTINSNYTVEALDNTELLKELTVEEKLEDFNYLFDIFLKNYPYFKIKKDVFGVNWINKKEEFKKRIENTTSNKEFYEALDDILGSLNNIHTDIINPYNLKDIRYAFENTKFKSWKNILENKEITQKNNQWQNILQESNENKKNQVIPIAFYYVDGKYIAYDLGEIPCENFEISKGDELISINGMEIDSYVKNKVKELKYDFVKNKVYTELLILHEENDFDINLRIKNNSGIKEKKLNSGIYNIVNYNLKDYSEKNLITEIIDENKVAYMAIKSFYYGNIEKDQKKVSNFLKSIEDYRSLIIDIRGNGGGAESYWNDLIVAPLIKEKLSYKYTCVYRDGEYIKPFIKERVGLVKKINNKNKDKISELLNETGKEFSYYKNFIYNIKPSKEKIDFKGKIYLLVDQNVYSAAESFAIFSKATGFATLVGVTTGGDGLGVDPIVFNLPNSGLIVRFPAEVGIDYNYKINEKYHTFPNIVIQSNTDEFIKNLDWKRKNQNKNISPYDSVLNTIISICK